MGFSKVRKWNWAAIEGTWAEEPHKGTRRGVLPPGTCQEGEERGSIWKAVADKKSLTMCWLKPLGQ